MKKLTLILVALISGTAFAQVGSASGTATVNAEIVSPITISENGTALNFGSLNAVEGTVTVTPKGVRGDVEGLTIATAELITASKFTINAADKYGYTIDIPGINLVGPEESTMPVTFTHELGGNTVTSPVGTGSDQELTVGGSLTVADGQTPGKYTGTVKVTVNYN